jgi:hypothetical protein
MTGWRDFRQPVFFAAGGARLWCPSGAARFVNATNAEFNGCLVHRTYLSLIRRFVRATR